VGGGGGGFLEAAVAAAAVGEEEGPFGPVVVAAFVVGGVKAWCMVAL